MNGSTGGLRGARSLALVAALAMAGVGCGGGSSGGGNTGGGVATPATIEMSVASGEVGTDSILLWALPSVAGTVTFEVSQTSTFAGAVMQTATSTEVDGVVLPVKSLFINLAGPGIRFFYRATDAAGASATGQFRTLRNTDTSFAFGVSGDWRGELAPFVSVSNVGDEDSDGIPDTDDTQLPLDFFVTLGDSIYADFPTPLVPAPQATTLTEYRTKHAEVYGSRFGRNELARIRALMPWYATIDDHEVTNNFAGGAPTSSNALFGGGTETFVNETPLYQAGIQAFREYHPTLASDYPTTATGTVNLNPSNFQPIGPDPRMAGKPRLFRSWTQGSGDASAAFFLLDQRSFRSQVAATVLDVSSSTLVTQFFETSYSPDDSTVQPTSPYRTLHGFTQLLELLGGLAGAQSQSVTWKFVLTPLVTQSAGPVAEGEDRWDGFGFERTMLLSFIAKKSPFTGATLTNISDHPFAGAVAQAIGVSTTTLNAILPNGITNAVFVSADVHGTLTNNLTFEPFLPPPFGTGFILGPTSTAAVPGCFEISTGAIAFDPPAGPQLISFGAAAGLLSAQQVAFYDALPTPEAKDGFFQQILNTIVRDGFGYDALGLDSNRVAGAGSLPTGLSFTQTQGGANAVHIYGWTKFEIKGANSANPGRLTVRTYGIDFYTEAELIANPGAIGARVPRVFQEFIVDPQ